MQFSGVYGYAGVHARVRAMYSTMLTQPELAGLIKAADYNALINLLKRTTYGPYLMRVSDSDLTPRRAAYQIKGKLADDYNTVIRTAPAYTRPLLITFYRYFEVENLKAVLRGTLTHASWDRIRYVLFSIGSLSVIPAQAMVETQNVADAIKLLRGSPYYETLSHAMERYTAEQSLFPLEVALDLNHWRELWKRVNELPNLDRDQAKHIIGSMIDISNLMWAIRYRVYYHLSEEELINYTLPFGNRVRDADIRAIAGEGNIAEVVMRVATRIYPDIPVPEDITREPREWLSELEVQLQKYIYYLCKRVFIGYPFHIGIPLAYLILRKMEIQDLTVLIEAKASQIPVERFLSLLIMDVAHI
jgi:V/A-type H+/Na+-transporting ATPase subunit C